MAESNRSTKGFDVVVVGAGLNGLVAAAYLAKGGRSVLVVERRADLGGAVGSEEIAPGFRVSSTYASAENFHPSIRRELKLAKHGLKLLRAKGAAFLPGKNGDRLAVGKRVRGIPAADKAAFAAFDSFLGRIANALQPAFTRPLPDVAPRNASDVLGLLSLGARLRRLGKKEMPEAMRYLPMSVKDVFDDHFVSEPLKALLAGPALRASFLAPRSAGSALQLLLERPAWSKGLLRPPVFVKGGLGSLADAVGAAARSAGVEIRTECTVEKVVHNDEGVATGVLLASGERVPCRVVLSNLDPRRTLLHLADARWLEPEAAYAVRNIRSRGTVALVHLALDSLPSFEGARGANVLAGRIQVGATLDEIEQAFDPVKYGEIPDRPFLEITIPTLTDPSLAPAGKHVMQVWTQWVPYHLAEGTWEERRDELGDNVVARIAEVAPEIASSILHRQVLTPRDLEERYGMTEGALYHVEPALDQSLYLRPMAGWYQYRTPIKNLYLCGPGTHPGGGVTGLPGKNAATRILADF